jgi:hypothetical protein
MLVHFDLIRGNLLFHAGTNISKKTGRLSPAEVAIPLDIESEYHFAIRRAGVSMDAIDAPEEVHITLTGLNPLVKSVNELTLQALETGQYQCVHDQLESPVKEFGRLVASLEAQYIELHKKLAKKNQS